MNEYDNHQADLENDPRSFRGFDEARHILWCYEARARVYNRLFITNFLTDTSVMAVHVDDWRRNDRIFLTAFDHDGQQFSADTLYHGDDRRTDCSLEKVFEFALAAEAVGRDVAQRSDLTAYLQQDGWVIDMRKLREYNHGVDVRTTQKAMILAQLPDLLADGDARSFLIGSAVRGGASAPPEPGSAGCPGAA